MLTEHRKELRIIGICFLLLCAVSAYRQISLRLIPNDLARPFIVYFVYLLLLVAWWMAICNRVPKSNMRSFLLVEQLLILIGITIRFIQDAFLYRNTYLMRVAGYWVVIPLLLLAVFSLYAALGLGKSEAYRIGRPWYLLLIPTGILTALLITNESHYLIFRVLPDEAQANLYFHPNVGIIVILAGAMLLLIVRVIFIYHRSRDIEGGGLSQKLPLSIAIFMLLFSVSYLASSYVVDFELIEYTAGMFFLEAMVWEACILAGMVPVNTRYQEVFDRSTIAMQIVDAEGHALLKSSCAPELSAEVFERLKQQETLQMPEGVELKLHKIQGGYAVWQNDLSQTLAVIDELEKSAEKLEQEGELLRQELKVRSDEAAVKEQNQIYNQLTDEIGKQLVLIQQLLQKHVWVQDKAILFKQICLIGTYIKRRCNLRLIEQSDGEISAQELRFCFDDLIAWLRQMGVDAQVHWSTTSTHDPEFSIFSLDVFEFLLEYERFELSGIKVVFETETAFSVWVNTIVCPTKQTPLAGFGRINKRNYGLSVYPCEAGYRVCATDGGDT